MSGGLLVVDKPGGMTSHDVVARVRRLMGTRKVGHAGTLDPMATGVLVVGVDRATRLLGHLTLTEKEYLGTVRLGATTTTDDAEGEVVSSVPVSVSRAEIDAAAAGLVGEIEQLPPAVSAIKVGGVRSYAAVRRGESVELSPRRVTVHALDVLGVDGVDVEVAVRCSSGTYVRALARDIGAALGTGGHLAALRRTRVGPYRAEEATPLEELTPGALVPLDEAAAAFPRRDLDAEDARRIGHGIPLAPTGREGPVAVFGPDGALLALVEDREGAARALCVLAG